LSKAFPKPNYQCQEGTVLNILALYAHPDDVECCCAGTLLKYKQAGHKIYIALTTSGNTGSNVIASREQIAATREAEQLAAAAYLDAEVMFLRYEDEFLFDTPETRRAVLTAIRWANPDVILTHHPEDFSTDHNMTSRLVTEVLLSVGGRHHPADLPPIEKAPQVFFADECGKAFVDVSQVMDTKLEMIRCHKSQVDWMLEFNPECELAETIRIQDHMRGIWNGCEYAESFTAHKILGYCADYRLLP